MHKTIAVPIPCTYRKYITYLCIHGNPACLWCHTEHAQWEICLVTLSRTAAVAMATNAVSMTTQLTAELATKYITMVTTIIDPGT